MCTAITYRAADSYVGRTLDLECTYGEEVTVTPRNFPLCFRRMPPQRQHYALVGMATVAQGVPLYYEAVNERGLAMAGLNFPDNAVYFPEVSGKDNVAPFELIPWVLGQCASLAEARVLLERLNLWEVSFSPAWPLTPLHWLVADREGALTVESMAEGLRLYDNPVGVLTNNPPFPYQMTHLRDYGRLTPRCNGGRLGKLELPPYSRGMGGIGLPGDLSSASRFVRAAFTTAYAVTGEGEGDGVGQVFHILDAVSQTRGCVRLPDGENVSTQYASCMNLSRGIYYYSTYENRSLSAVDLYRCDLEGNELFRYPLHRGQRISWHN